MNKHDTKELAFFVLGMLLMHVASIFNGGVAWMTFACVAVGGTVGFLMAVYSRSRKL